MPGLWRWRTPVVQTQLTSTGDLDIKFGGVMKNAYHTSNRGWLTMKTYQRLQRIEPAPPVSIGQHRLECLVGLRE